MSLLVTNDGELQVAAADLIDITDPTAMAFNCVCRQSNQFDATLGELWLKFRKGTQFSCANRCVIFRVREEDYPAVADEIVEVDGPIGGVCVEIGCNATQAQSREMLVVQDTHENQMVWKRLTVEDALGLNPSLEMCL